MPGVKILALDTATEACSVALLLGDTILARYEEPKRGHAELILPMVDAVLAEAGIELRALDCFAVGRGPGAFTGVRIAVSVAQGLAFGVERPIVPVSDLAALAQRAVQTHGAKRVLACLDARLGEVYWAAFETDAEGLVAAITDERVGPPGSVAVPAGQDWFGVGTGWAAHSGLATQLSQMGVAMAGIDNALLPRAHEIARLAARDFRKGLAVSPEQALPVYVRDSVAVSSRKSQT
ncbi:MAG TPA: tRNA (adenosine(37)-N6)-threonylcarbamoyltransferase complex dimerization subunit type 1 TsaB [Steroidobacteraceae bacterium]|nr:tRNA (adenosine(37)-N6)-threonylcarbamoyltransferase complex dimerization subunit type 1 TsaB [Steroidobacteraceae bacterium]